MKTWRQASFWIFECVWMCSTSRMIDVHSQTISVQGWMHVYTAHQHDKGQVDYRMSWEHTHAQYWCHVTLIDVRKSHTFSEALRENAWSWDEVFSPSQAIDQNLVDLSDSSDWAAFVLNYHCQPEGHWRREQSRKIKTRRSQRLKGAGLFSLLTVRVHLASI